MEEVGRAGTVAEEGEIPPGMVLVEEEEDNIRPAKMVRVLELFPALPEERKGERKRQDWPPTLVERRQIKEASIYD